MSSDDKKWKKVEEGAEEEPGQITDSGRRPRHSGKGYTSRQGELVSRQAATGTLPRSVRVRLQRTGKLPGGD